MSSSIEDHSGISAGNVVAHAVLVALVFTGFAVPLAAQSIALNMGDSARMFVAPNAKLTVPVSVDLTAAGSLNLASLQAGLSWGASRLTFDSIRVVPSTGFSLTPNTANAASGSLTFNTFSATALAASGPLFNLYFTAGATSGGTRVALAPAVAGTDLAQDILSHLVVRNVDVCVATRGTWGDVTADGLVNIVDAQQIARYSVGFPVVNATATAARGDVTADGAVDIIDAQQVARFSVALSAAARVSTPWVSVATVATVAVTPTTAILAMGQTVGLSATLQDSTAAPVTGCYPVTWTSSDTTVATVSSAGVVTAVRGGTATLTAASGGRVGNATVTVTSVVASISISPISFGIMVGDTVTLTDTAYDAASHVVTGLPTTWTQPGNATIAPNGLLTGTLAGYAPLRATVAGFTNSGSGGVTVYSTVDSVRFAGWTDTTLAVGASKCVMLYTFGSAGSTSALRWTVVVSDTTALQQTVTSSANSNGLMTHCFQSLKNAPVTVTASFGGKSVIKPLNQLSGLQLVFTEHLADNSFNIYSMRGDQTQKTFVNVGTGPTWKGNVILARGAYQDNQIYSMDSTGAGWHQILGAGPSYAPDFSPNGSKFVLMYGDCAGGHPLATVNVDGSGQTMLNICSTSPARWSPLGNRIAYVYGATIYTANVDGTGVTTVATLTTDLGGVAWSPDETRLLFSWKPSADANFGIYSIKTDGTNQQQITNVAADDLVQDWSATGDWVLFFSTRSGSSALWLMHADGSSVQRLSTITATSDAAQWRKP